MKTHVDPVLGGWYTHIDKGGEFQVVAFDETDGVVEIQHYDGDIEAMELEDWREMELEQIEPPADWGGAMDDFENGDSGYPDTGMADDDWNDALSE